MARGYMSVRIPLFELSRDMMLKTQSQKVNLQQLRNA